MGGTHGVRHVWAPAGRRRRPACASLGRCLRDGQCSCAPVEIVEPEAELKLEPQLAAARALDLARLSPSPNPNPRVGCVVVSPDGTLLAEGYHRGAGTWHAEAAAINDAVATGTSLKGATAYVTLEPCAHHGRTPSCARALVRAGVAHVVYGQPDPNGPAAGGAAILTAAGIAVRQNDDLRAGSEDLNRDWTFSVTHHRPVVRWKFAGTLDGFSAAPDGSSQWITGPAARADVHRLRAQHGAIVVGTGTVLTDDPHLTTRTSDGTLAARQPLRVVVGRRPVPDQARVLDAAAETLLLSAHDPAEVLAELTGRDIHAVWLEGGPTLAAAFLQAGLVDEVIAYLAPALLGSGRPVAADLGTTSMADLRRFALSDVAMLPSSATAEQPAQTDLRLTLTPTSSASRSSVPEPLKEN